MNLRLNKPAGLLCYSFLVFLTYLLISCRPAAEEDISAGDLDASVSYLASDALAGREVGSAGIRLAEDYIASRFGRYGLKPLPGQTGYFLDFSLYKYGFDSRKTSLLVRLPGTRLAAVPGDDFTPFYFSGTGRRTAGLVFAGYGITAPEYHYDDYAHLPVTGKFVLVLRHTPNQYDSQSPFAGSAKPSPYAYFSKKIENAKKHGAAGMIIINDPLFQGTGYDMRFPALYSPESGLPRANSRIGRFLRNNSNFIVLVMGDSMAEKVFSANGYTLRDIQKAIDQGAAPRDFLLKNTVVSVSVAKTRRPERIGARNVAGFIRGSRPQLKKQWIVIGAHHDHLGAFKGRGDTVYNGANDNASGVGALLELVGAFSRSDAIPERNLLFVTFSAEEEGLLGSKNFIAQNMPPAETIRYMVNIDMIGQNPANPLYMYTTGITARLRNALLDLNSEGLVISHREHIPEGYTSDNEVFASKGIPTIFFSSAVNDDYHTVTDQAEKLDYHSMQKVVRFIYRVIDKLANDT